MFLFTHYPLLLSSPTLATLTPFVIPCSDLHIHVDPYVTGTTQNFTFPDTPALATPNNTADDFIYLTFRRLTSTIVEVPHR